MDLVEHLNEFLEKVYGNKTKKVFNYKKVWKGETRKNTLIDDAKSRMPEMDVNVSLVQSDRGALMGELESGGMEQLFW